MRHLAYSIAFTLVLVLFGPPAAADDAAGETPGGGDSAAEVAFRDAYWAETTRGALNEALTGYAKASEADGPEAVRAQALYRLAVVQERLGRTGEAIRTLERLAAAFPQEASWQAKAQERLAEWTAVDLRTNFAEWYRRYLYSPEFQARVVEHVLALGSKAPAANATSELLTIGEPAIPALEVHLDTPNQALRGRVVDLLLRLGRVPHPKHLVATYDWRRARDNWRRLLTLPPERQAELRQQVEGDSDAALALRALLGGRRHWPEALRRESSSALTSAILEQPMDDALRDGLLALAEEPLEDSFQRTRNLLDALLQREAIPAAVARRWLRGGSRDLAAHVLEWIAKGRLPGAPYLDDLLTRMAETSPDDSSSLRKLGPALVRALADTPLAAIDWDRVVPTYLGALGSYVHLPTPAGGGAWHRAGPALLRRFLAEVVQRAQDPNVAGSALHTLAQSFRGDPAVWRLLVALAEDETSDPKLREAAARYLGEVVTAETLDETLAVLVRLPRQPADVLLNRLGRQPKLQSFAWTETQQLLLMDWLVGGGGAHHSEALDFFEKLHLPRYRLENTLRLALRAPTRIWPEALDERRAEFKEIARDLVQCDLPGAWEGWTPQERAAALRLFRSFLIGSGSEALAPFFRTKLHAEATSPPVRKLLARALPPDGATLEDVRAAYDLEDPQSALDATQALQARYPHTLEIYEALAAARRDPDPLRRLLFWKLWGTQEAVDLQRRVARDMLEDPSADHRQTALGWLARVRAEGDTARFAKALADPEAKVRIAAATHLARQWNPEAVRALVQALDDPDAAVRDRVLETLEAIKEIETKKEYWREAVREGEIRDR